MIKFNKKNKGFELGAKKKLVWSLKFTFSKLSLYCLGLYILILNFIFVTFNFSKERESYLKQKRREKVYGCPHYNHQKNLILVSVWSFQIEKFNENDIAFQISLKKKDLD